MTGSNEIILRQDWKQVSVYEHHLHHLGGVAHSIQEHLVQKGMLNLHYWPLTGVSTDKEISLLVASWDSWLCSTLEVSKHLFFLLFRASLAFVKDSDSLFLALRQFRAWKCNAPGCEKVLPHIQVSQNMRVMISVVLESMVVRSFSVTGFSQEFLNKRRSQIYWHDNNFSKVSCAPWKLEDQFSSRRSSNFGGQSN